MIVTLKIKLNVQSLCMYLYLDVENVIISCKKLSVKVKTLINILIVHTYIRMNKLPLRKKTTHTHVHTHTLNESAGN